MYEKYLDKLQDYLTGENRTHSTRIFYKGNIIRFLEIIGNPKPEDITEEDIQKYKVYCNTKGNNGKPYDINTLVAYYSSVKIFLKYVVKLPDEITRLLKIPMTRYKPKETLSEDEIRRLFSASKYDKRDNAIIKVLYYTAIRRGELIKLNVEDIDFENKTITTWYAKGGYCDVRNIYDKALESIKEYLEIRFVHPNPMRRNGETTEQYNARIENSKKALFLNRNGTARIGTTDVHTTVKKYAIISGITKKMSPHTMRRTSITHLYQNGLGIVEVQAISKHSNINTLTTYYINPSKERVTRLYNKAFNNLEDNPKPKPDKPTPEDRQPEQPKPNDNPSDSYIAKQEMVTLPREEYDRLMAKLQSNIGYV